MVTTEVVIAKMNAMTSVIIGEEGENVRVSEVRPVAPIIPSQTEVQLPVEPMRQSAEPMIDPMEQNVATVPDGTEETASNIEQSTEPVEIPMRRSAKIARGVSQPERYLLLTKIQETTWKLDAEKEQAKLGAIQKEIMQIFEELQAVMPVMKDEVPEDAEVLRCFIFLVETFFANGEFEKIKAHLVANGAQQKKNYTPINHHQLRASMQSSHV
jgi:hypothetical protein